MTNFRIDPDDVLDFAFDYTTATHGKPAFLADAETISSHTVTAGTGVTVDSSDEADGIVTVWVSGATKGAVRRITCHIVTSDGRELDRTMAFDVSDR